MALRSQFPGPVLIFAGLCLFLHGCGSSGDATEPEPPQWVELDTDATRYPPVTAVAVQPSSARFRVGGRVDFDATAQDSSGDAIGASFSWSSSNTAVAMVDQNGVVTGRSGGAAEITAELDLVTIERHPFDGLSNGGSWNVWDDANLSVVSRSDAPRSPSNVARARLPEGGAGGHEHGNFMSIGIQDHDLTTLYVSVWFRYSDDWHGHDSGVNKILYLLREGSPGGPVYISAQGANDGSLEPQLRMQNSGESFSRVLEPNVNSSVSVTRGEWHRWEVRLEMNTEGQKDGTAEWWLDGIKVGEYEDVAWVPEGKPHVWGQIKFQPIWGGIGDELLRDQFLFVDEILIRGK